MQDVILLSIVHIVWLYKERWITLTTQEKPVAPSQQASKGKLESDRPTDRPIDRPTNIDITNILVLFYCGGSEASVDFRNPNLIYILYYLTYKTSIDKFVILI